MSDTNPIQRATEAVQQRSTWPSLHWGMKTVLHREAAAALSVAALTAALDDPDLGPRISTWRGVSCEHSRVVNQWRHDQTGEPLLYEDACSPCVRDRMRAWLLGGDVL